MTLAYYHYFYVLFLFLLFCLPFFTIILIKFSFIIIPSCHSYNVVVTVTAGQ